MHHVASEGIPLFTEGRFETLASCIREGLRVLEGVVQ